MAQVDRAGLFQGEIKDFGVTVTRKAKLPQFVVTLSATELYNDAEETWDNWAEYEQTITGYFVLVSLDAHGQVNKCLNYDQVMQAVGWDGETYSGLASMDLKGKRVQFRVIEDTYNGNVNLKVNWIDAEDAEVGLRKLSGKDLTNLDAKFGAVIPKKKAVAATPKATKKTTTKKVTAPKPPKPPKTTKEIEKSVKPCTEEEAYQACIEENDNLKKPIPGEILDDYWVTHVTEIAADTDNVTNEEWGKIREATLGDIRIPF